MWVEKTPVAAAHAMIGVIYSQNSALLPKLLFHSKFLMGLICLENRPVFKV